MSLVNITIKEINTKNIDELNKCVDIIKQSFIKVRDDLSLTKENCPSHPSFIKVEDLFKLSEKDVFFYGLFLSEKQIGLYIIEKGNNGYYYVEKLSTLPDYRHKGYGKKMMKHAIEYSVKNNAKGISVALINEQKILKNWYKSIGFIEMSKKQFDHLPFTVCFMELNNDLYLNEKEIKCF